MGPIRLTKCRTRRFVYTNPLYISYVLCLNHQIKVVYSLECKVTYYELNFKIPFYSQRRSLVLQRKEKKVSSWSFYLSEVRGGSVPLHSSRRLRDFCRNKCSRHERPSLQRSTTPVLYYPGSTFSQSSPKISRPSPSVPGRRTSFVDFSLENQRLTAFSFFSS